jgi:hypothetical protein
MEAKKLKHLLKTELIRYVQEASLQESQDLARVISRMHAYERRAHIIAACKRPAKQGGRGFYRQGFRSGSAG